jgi:hypothetical protein
MNKQTQLDQMAADIRTKNVCPDLATLTQRDKNIAI